GSTKVIVDSQGTLWLACPDKVLFLPKGEQELQVLNEHVDGDSSIAESPSGDLWLQDQSGIRSIRKYDNPGGQAVKSTYGVLVDRNGTLWLRSFPGGLRRFVPPQGPPARALTRWQDMTDRFTAKDGMTSDTEQTSMVEDREGNVWIGTVRGLDRFSEPQLVKFPLTEEGCAAIEAADGGGLWVAQSVGYAPSPISSIENDSLATRGPALRVTSVLRVDDGSTWFGGKEG